jgi:type I restriction enzyme, S subunit
MSDNHIKSLDSIASRITDKATFRKDPTKPYIGLEHLPSGGTVLLGIAQAEQSVSTNSVFRTGDILFGKLRPRLRKSVRVPFDGYCSTDILVLRPSALVDPAFAGFILQSDLVFAEAIRTEEGTKMPRCSWNTLRKLQIFCPTLPKQEYIAEILLSIDKAIAQTKALIQKYQQIKAGLMHDLFTRGITSDGQLRPPREEAPELYQETAIGWIPREWDVKRCEAICDRICVGIVIRPADYYVNEGIPTFRSANVRENAIDASNLVYISEINNQILFKSQIHTNDILTVRTGYPGTSAVVSSHYDASNCVDILISTPSDFIDSNFLCFWINSSFGKEQVLRKQGGLAQQHFNVGQMKSLLVVLPDDKEQNRIVERLDSIASKISVEEEFSIKLEKQKSGLMHDLLTGKVPITISKS